MAQAHEVPHGWMKGRQFLIREGTEFSRTKGFHTGDRVKVVMVSRFGDVGVTEDLDAVGHYGARLHLDDLTDLSMTPEAAP